MIEFNLVTSSTIELDGPLLRKGMVTRVDRLSLDEGAERSVNVLHGHFSGSGADLIHVTSSGHRIELTDDETLTVMIPVSGDLLVEAHGRDLSTTGPDTLAFLPSRRATKVRRTGARRFEAYLLKAPVVRDRALGTSLRAMTHDGAVIQHSKAAAALSDLISYVLRVAGRGPDPALSPRWEALIEELIAEHLRLATETRTETAPLSPDRTVRVADDFMQAHFDNPLRLEDIARAARVSPRQLQSAYRSVAGMTPWDRLTGIRLRNARQLLLNAHPGETVTEIAIASGLSHFGRFSSAYKQAFGELPSQTLRRQLQSERERRREE